MSFTRQPCPIWLFTDLNGNILDDTYYAFFLENDIPYLPQNVYMSEQGSVGGVWSNPLQFSANGTLPNNLYFENGLTYRIEIRQGNTQSDPLIALIENFVPNGSDEPVPTVALPIDNMITNPQFAFLSFNGTLTITNTGNNSYDIAPGWVLDIDSSGSVVVTVERIAIAGNDPTPSDNTTNPSYVLKVSLVSGIPTVYELRQRFTETPAIWAEEGVSVNFTGKTESVSANIEVLYRPSTGTSQTIISETLSTAYQVISNGVQLPASDNTDTGTSAYVDIVFVLPQGTTYLTNIQAIGSPSAAPFPYSQTTPQRQKDYTFHYYADSLQYQPKSTLLTGWTFALNPWQFRSPASSNLANNDYTADQTIIIQQDYVTSATGNNISVGRAAAADNYALQVTAVTANNKFSLTQYIDPTTIRPYWGKNLSVMVNARISTGHGTTCRFKVRLIYRTSLPPTIAQNEPVASWSATAGSDPVLAGGWTYIEALNDPIYTFSDGSSAFTFNQFTLPAASTDDMTLGIMLYTLDATNQTAPADILLFDRITLVQNDFAIDANPETYDETLRKCQYYYEKSYAPSVAIGTATDSNCISIYSKGDSDGTQTQVWPPRLFWQYKNTKRTDSPTITLYSLAGTSGNVSVEAVNGTNGVLQARTDKAITQWTQTDIGPDSVTYYCNGTTTNIYSVASSSIQAQGYTNFHYTIDARLGK